MDGSQLAGDAEVGAKIAKRRAHWPLKRLLIVAAAPAFLAVMAIYGHYYWTIGRFLVSTDDAYVEAHSVLISPKVSGYISEAPVNDNQPVKAGEVLARIDPHDYQTALAVDGTVGVRTLQVGEYVQPGTQLMAVAPLQAVYITANYKETQLTDVRPGQPATIDVDTFPGTPVHGHVDSLAPASGQEFALLPPDNATGNFTKIVQRIPVKIEIDKNEPLLGKLRPGMSVEPTIDTRAAAAAARSGSAP